ncbi:PREDICTED: CLAVATA3/ESR (CLE)-related protein 25-like isoform X2 [Lupinus angustifolius]|uniref:CLAVATA3/ESR (CLE)-related protein 25-like isoform X2 n=1 Tax=Lupinus angustifolius TaxID=3871 RepID=UPI00092F1FA6|nr:PREDICTED: CLAVATA3/ESR (CLE)-related protein 25-like isoform X2 [Lupinus angustifolius]
MGVVVVVGVRSRIRFVLGALIFVGVIWFMFLAISMDLHQTKRTMVLVPLHVKRHSLHSNSGLIFVSKRKVPNGPDPIHNRRAVKFRQPPTQA